MSWLKIARVCAQVIWARNFSKRTGLLGVPKLSILDAARVLVHGVTRKNCIWLAKQYMDLRGFAEGQQFAQEHVLPAKAAEVYLLQANAAGDDDQAWLDAINAYLDTFGLSPISLATGYGSRFARLRPGPITPITAGPLVSVIMPAFNARSSINTAIESILGQSWQNLELIVVDDCSTDGTWEIMKAAANRDNRVRLLRNVVNVGPYVSKNLALRIAKGVFITGQDADDWSHPERLQRDVERLIDSRTRATMSTMVRMSADGRFCLSHFPRVSLRMPAAISLLIEAAWLREVLGAWDSVRFGADNELISRAEQLLGSALRRSDDLSMFCMELPQSLGNHPVYGYSAPTGLSPVRQQYKRNYRQWHSSISATDARMAFPPVARPYAVPEEMKVPLDAIQRNIDAHNRQIQVDETS